MTERLEEWIDEALSRELPLLRERGEGQDLEFMRSYPENAHELSREIAAFASSNGGTILLGVEDDDGSLACLKGVDTASGRDALCRRIEGVCNGVVRPSITPTVKFAKDEDAIVVAVMVPRGSQPMYYSKHRPYIRHLTQSRPAEPHEVIEQIANWLATNPHGIAADSSGSRFVSDLATILVDVLIDADEFEERKFNPWLDQARTQLGAAGQQLRQLAADDQAVQRNLDVRLRALADEVESAASHRLTFGPESWNTLATYVRTAKDQAAALKAAVIDDVPLSAQARTELADLIKRSSRQLADLDLRAERMAREVRIQEVQEEASVIGRNILTASHYSWMSSDSPLITGLREIGRSLHLLETQRLYMDGGESVRRIIQSVHDLSGRLQELTTDHL